MYVKPVARHCWLSGLRRRPLRLLRASGMAKDAVDVLKRRLRFCFSLSSTLLLYGQIWQRRCRAAAAGAVLKPQGGNCAVLP